MAYAHPAFQEEVWSGRESKIVVDSVAPVGKAERVRDKWRVEGRWRFVSGVNWADFCAVNALAIFEEGGRPEPAFFMIPKGDYRVEYDWNVVGLKGTASNSVVVEGALVPEHRVLRLLPIAKEGIPLNPKLQDSPLYRTQFIPMLATAIYAPALGGAQRALELFQGWMEKRIRPYAFGIQERDAPGSQRLLAEMNILFDAVHALSERHTREIYTLGQQRRSQDEPLLRARFFAQRAWMARTCVKIVERLFLSSGGNALYESHPMQQVWRDTHAAVQHVAVVYEDALASLGREQMGLSGHPLL
jgi:3-hydroxy-9,10-secoandrosta-1,3,5(10)-triene-9,17-dione monooxygenase